MRRALLAAAMAGCVAAGATTASAEINPFDDPFTGPTENSGQVGFKVHSSGDNRSVRGFEWASVFGLCNEGEEFLDGKNGDSMHVNDDNKFHDKGHNADGGSFEIWGRFTNDNHAKGRIALRGKWNGYHHCIADEGWTADRQ